MTFLNHRRWPILFNLLFWTPFWFFPLLGVTLRRGSLGYPLVMVGTHALGSMLFSMALAAAAEASGRHRRYFYLVAGVICWIGAQTWTMFIYTSASTIVTDTIATAAEYFHGDGGTLSYINISPGCVLPLAGACLPFLLLWRFWHHLDWPLSKIRIIAGAVLALAIFPLNSINRIVKGTGDEDNHVQTPLYRVDLYPPGDTYYQVWRYFDLLATMRRYRAQSPLVAHAGGAPLTLIVMVGESTSRKHMSLYGYCRDTTPRLKARTDITAFDNVISNFPLTIFALYNLFSIPSAPTRDGNENTTLFSLLNQAGFDTEWISNQYQYGGPTDVLTTIMSATQKQVWARRRLDAGEHFTTDDVLLPYVDKALASAAPRKAVFLHMMGTHSEYADRYPRDFAYHWPPLPARRDAATLQDIDRYDTAVRYQDTLLDDVIRKAAADGDRQNIAVVYFSDHGEETYDEYPLRLHAYPGATRDMVEIPMIVWLSPAFKRQYPDLAKAVAAARHDRLQTRDIAPLLLDLAQVQTKGDTLAHPLQPGFQEGVRLVTKYDYDRDPNLGRTPQLRPLCSR